MTQTQHDPTGCPNRTSTDHYDMATAILKLAKLIAEHANAQDQAKYDLRFCLPTGARMYRDLSSGTLVPFKKINGRYVPVSL